MSGRRPDVASENRLAELRREAETSGRVGGAGLRPSGSPLPEATAANGYYGLPLLKPPVWTWEVPAYFFVGGTAGAAACIAFAARLSGADPRLVRNAQWVAAAGAAVSMPLLIADLGRPERFLNMLRVFKPQSPMSVGAWLLASFGGASSLAIVARGRVRDLASAVAALTGLGMATYTGVLVGATAIPVWSRHVSLLPAHFGASALGSAASTLELIGHRESALQNLARIAAAFETAAGVYIESRRDQASRPIRRGHTGTTAHLGGALSGPIPLLIRLLYGRSRRARQAAAVSTVIGSLITRFAWVEAGRASAADPRAALGSDGGDAAGAGKAVGERSPVRKNGHGKADSAGEQ